MSAIEVLEERLARIEKATDLQASEYSRRLDELNHAHAKQVQDQATYVGREAFDTFRESVSTKLTLLEGRSGGMGSVWALFFQIVPLLISLAALAAVSWRSAK